MQQEKYCLCGQGRAGAHCGCAGAKHTWQRRPEEHSVCGVSDDKRKARSNSIYMEPGERGCRHCAHSTKNSHPAQPPRSVQQWPGAQQW